jgi:RNA polymerase sigma-70 factor (ECF subfamily)
MVNRWKKEKRKSEVKEPSQRGEGNMDARKTLGVAPARQAATPADTHLPQARPKSPLSAEQVYHDYAPRVYNVARRMVASDIDAEDVTQDVLLQVVRKLPSFRGESAFPTWLHRVTVNAALSHRRRLAVRQEHGPRCSLDAYRVDQPVCEALGRRTLPPEDLLAGHELKQIIDRAIDSLPVAYRTVFVLADVEGLPNAEIGARLGMSLPAVKSRLHRARAMLRDALAPHL